MEKGGELDVQRTSYKFSFIPSPGVDLTLEPVRSSLGRTPRQSPHETGVCRFPLCLPGYLPEARLPRQFVSFDTSDLSTMIELISVEFFLGKIQDFPRHSV